MIVPPTVLTAPPLFCRSDNRFVKKDCNADVPVEFDVAAVVDAELEDAAVDAVPADAELEDAVPLN